MDGLTIFAMPKAFDGHAGTIQRNAIASWIRLAPRPEIVLFGNDAGTDAASREFSVRHIADVASTDHGTPRVDDLFRQAEATASGDVLAYVNADIILLTDFITSIRRVADEHDRFLIVGRRYDTPVAERLDFEDPGWAEKLIRDYRTPARLKSAGWIDYFIFSAGFYGSIPPFALGRTFWDKWLVWHAVTAHGCVIDATSSITAFHQDHGYQHAPGAKRGVWEGAEPIANIRAAGGWRHGYTIRHAPFILDGNRIVPNRAARSLRHTLSACARSVLDRLFFLTPLVLRVRRLLNRL